MARVLGSTGLPFGHRSVCEQDLNLRLSGGFASTPERRREGGDGDLIPGLFEVLGAQDECRGGLPAGKRLHRGERLLESDAADRYEEGDGREVGCLAH